MFNKSAFLLFEKHLRIFARYPVTAAWGQTILPGHEMVTFVLLEVSSSPSSDATGVASPEQRFSLREGDELEQLSQKGFLPSLQQGFPPSVEQSEEEQDDIPAVEQLVEQWRLLSSAQSCLSSAEEPGSPDPAA